MALSAVKTAGADAVIKATAPKRARWRWATGLSCLDLRSEQLESVNPDGTLG